MAVGEHHEETMAENEENGSSQHVVPLKIKRFTFSGIDDWMPQGGSAYRGFIISAVGVAAFAILIGLVAFVFLFILTSLNAAFASFLVAMSIISFMMAFFFSSITMVYVGALGFGGLTIGSIAFFSVWPVIILLSCSTHSILVPSC